MEQRWQALKDQGYQQALIIQADASFNTPPTQAFCKQVRDKTAPGLSGPPLTFPVLYDPTGEAQDVLNWWVNEANLVLDATGTITFKGHYTSTATVEAEIDKVLPP